MKELQFNRMHRKKILDENKWLTVRWDHEAEYEAGEEIQLVSDSLPLGKAIVLSTNMVTLEEFAEQEIRGHRNYHSAVEPDWKSMWRKLISFYPDIPEQPDTEIKVIAWKLVETDCRIQTEWGEIRVT